MEIKEYIGDFGLYADPRNVCYVNDDGTLNWNDCDWSNGVRPFWWIVRAIRFLMKLKGVRHIKRAYIPSHRIVG